MLDIMKEKTLKLSSITEKLRVNHLIVSCAVMVKIDGTKTELSNIKCSQVDYSYRPNKK